jgi:C-terminal processing protease CtpA/Prc
MRFVALLTATLTIAAPALAQAPNKATSAVSKASAERVADLLRLWNYVRLFDIDSRAMTPQWETALADASASAFAAKDDAALQPVVNAMMARIDGAAPELPQNAAAEKHVPAFRVADGHAVASCASIAGAYASGQEPDGDADAFAAAAKKGGMILDCRRFPPAPQGDELRQIAEAWFPQGIAPYLTRPVPRGAVRMRMHDGYPPDEGSNGGGYQRGTIDQDLGTLAPEKPGKGAGTRMVVLVDPSSPAPAELAGGLQASRQARVIAQGALPNDGVSAFASAHVHALVKTGSYVAPDDRVGFRPNACIPANASDAAVLRAASAMLAGGKGTRCSAAWDSAVNSAPAEPTTDAETVPSLGERMIALAKLWGTFEYFHAYKNLDSQPWESELEAFVPVFAAADTRAAYEDAVSRLAARADDSHIGVSGTSLTALSPQRYAPPVYVRPVEGGFAVAGLHDATLADRLHVGDEIISVDGRPAKDVVAPVDPLIAAATPQALAQREAIVLLAGAKGTQSRLTIRRGDAPPFDVTMERSIPMYRAAGRPDTKDPSFRRIGSNIGYVDLARITRDEADRAMDQLMDTKAIIFDLRGYPKGTAWAIAPRLARDGREGAVAGLFRRPIYLGPSEPEENWKSFTQSIPTGEKPRYRGKVVVLIDDRAISQAEYTAQFFEAAANPIFVGTPTTGTNGDVTYVDLPGGLYVGFTGHDVRHADGRQLQRVGIQPNVRVAPTFKGMASGHDEVLEAGLTFARQR